MEPALWYRRSGQTIAAFAREHHMSAPLLYWWRKRLPQDGAVPMMSLVPGDKVLIVIGGIQ